MDTVEIVLIAVVVVFALLALGGRAVLRRRSVAGAADFALEIEQANRDLAEAHAADNGWEPARVTEAARAAFAESKPGVAITTIELVQVIDRPGIDADEAVFRVVGAGGRESQLVLARRGGSWQPK